MHPSHSTRSGLCYCLHASDPKEGELAQATRTNNPLPFQDLEPRRFEDLVRHLAYYFKPWRKLEPTGRTGSDGGFDARGYEIIPADEQDDQEVVAEDEGPPPAQPDRLWLIQCKREKTITPKKLRTYLDEIPVETRAELYGVIFAAACDFSKATRDILNDWARKHGISEAHIWGKGDLEDQLYQPKNDNLLFAYFGISLLIRRRSLRTALPSRLAMKKRAEVVLRKAPGLFLLRDPTDDRYPFTDDLKKNRRGRWRVFEFAGFSAFGLKYLVKTHFAYVNDTRTGWDMVDSVNNAEPTYENSWASQQDSEARALYHRVWYHWQNIPDANRATFHREWCIGYEDILAIDEEGDEFAKFPHVFAESATGSRVWEVIKFTNSFIEPFYPDPAQRIKYFPDTFPDLPPPKPAQPIPGEDEPLARRS